ncbi:MAG: CBS domain-containing protein [Burkholderiaceae bacterium]
MDGQHYRALSQSKLKAGAAYHLPDLTMPSHVSINSPAVDVMTDLRHTAAVTTTLDTFIDDANREMISHGVRTLLAIDDQRHVVGIVTSTDILGEKPMQITHERGIRHAEIMVRDVMTPAHRLEVIDLQAVLNAKVGDVQETLRRARRQHALVVDQEIGELHMVRGIFSATQIARQLDIAPSPPETGDTFAEIETAIGS